MTARNSLLPEPTQSVAATRTERVAVSTDAQATRDQRHSARTRSSVAGDVRSPSRRDRDKVLYASAFQRLAGVTQVVTPEPGGALTHNRLTHSLKVAQVARSIAELLLSQDPLRPALVQLGGLDADVAEAAGLAHDLGHPPFGHVGEMTLDRFARTRLGLSEGFEGNAQSFRIMARLDARSPSYDGMDLTAATRCAVLKYPWLRAERGESEQEHRRRLSSNRNYALQWTKFGCYLEEAADFEQARSIPGVLDELQSVEAAIMDLADDVTYALHDLQDFYVARILPVPAVVKELRGHSDNAARRGSDATTGDGASLNALAGRLSRSYPERFDHEQFIMAVRAVLGDISTNFAEYFDATPDALANVTKFVSRKIGELTKEIKINSAPSGERAAVYVPDEQWHQIQVLKHLTSVQVIGRPDMAVFQRAQQKVLTELLVALKAWSEDADDAKRLPQPLREWRERASDEGRTVPRCTVDFVAGLADQQAVSLHHALTQGDSGLVRALVL